MERIPVNLWDDYWEDGYIPEGEKQETYMYVEDSSISLDDRKKMLKVVFDRITLLKLKDTLVYMFFYDSKNKYPTLDDLYHFKRWEIRFENLSHKQREKLVDDLNKSNLKFDNIAFNFYSES